MKTYIPATKDDCTFLQIVMQNEQNLTVMIFESLENLIAMTDRTDVLEIVEEIKKRFPTFPRVWTYTFKENNL